MPAPEETSPYNSDSWIIALKLKAEENSRTMYLFLISVLENNKGIVFYEALLLDVYNFEVRHPRYVGSITKNCLAIRNKFDVK